MSQKSNVCCYDFTVGKKFITKDALIKILSKNCKKYSFQLEKGEETNYLHFQGRFSLKIKKRIKQVIELFNCKEIHFSITSNANRDNMFYVEKEETRVDGPWTDKDKPIYIPRQIREIEKLRPFQEKIIELSKVWDTRTINLIYCPKGNKGKSILKGYMFVNKLGRFLPFCNNYQDIMRMVCNLPTSNCYLIDLPKALNKERLGGMWSAIETIKDGYAYDDRYNFTEKYFDCPNIFVFTNKEPDYGDQSLDRWKIWTIDDEYRLVKYTSECLITT